MTTTSAVSIAARLTLVLTAGLVAGARDAQAQTTPDQPSAFQFLVPSGTLVPTGVQRGAIKRADLTAVQASYMIGSNIAVTTTVGWARSRDIATAGDPKLDVFTYDVGAELRCRPIGDAVTFRSFLGAGAGARSYNYRSLDVDATHNLAGYGSVGGELGYRRVALRIEGRDYVSGFKPLAGTGPSDRRNDVAILVGLRLAR